VPGNRKIEHLNELSLSVALSTCLFSPSIVLLKHGVCRDYSLKIFNQLNFFATHVGDLCCMENIKNIMKLPEFEEVQGPVLMLNMLKFKDREYYFETYLPAFRKVTEKLGINDVKVRLLCNVVATILASENEAWDAIALIEYPSAKAFKTIAESDAYRDIANQHRLAATDKLHLYMTTPFEL